jgi:hypothetical protein
MVLTGRAASAGSSSGQAGGKYPHSFIPEYALLQMLFLLAYTVMYAGGGKVADALGTRLVVQNFAGCGGSLPGFVEFKGLRRSAI